MIAPRSKPSSPSATSLSAPVSFAFTFTLVTFTNLILVYGKLADILGIPLPWVAGCQDDFGAWYVKYHSKHQFE